MNFNEYQTLAARTLKKEESIEINIVNLAMGIAGESGETVDYLKKVLFHGHEFEVEKFASELGDILWYVTSLCTILNINLEEIADYNVQKLIKRYPDGFKTEDSINRSDDDEKQV